MGILGSCCSNGNRRERDYTHADAMRDHIYDGLNESIIYNNDIPQEIGLFSDGSYGFEGVLEDSKIKTDLINLIKVDINSPYFYGPNARTNFTRNKLAKYIEKNNGEILYSYLTKGYGMFNVGDFIKTFNEVEIYTITLFLAREILPFDLVRLLHSYLI